jgi:hypothetical protein
MTADHVWVFKAERATFPCGVFTGFRTADAWIAKHRLTGVLTQYPLNEGVYDWATANGLFRHTKPPTPEFVGAFTSHYQKHYHYESGATRGTDQDLG